MTYEERQEKFKRATRSFLRSNRGPDDLFRLAVAVSAATKQGCGLLFDDVEKAIGEAWGEEEARNSDLPPLSGYPDGD